MKRDLSAVIITNLMFSFVYFLPLVVLPLYVKRLGASLWLTGLVISFYYLTTTLFSIFWGVLSDIFGKRKIFLFSSLTGSASVLFITSLVKIPLLVVLLMGAFGLVTSAFRPPTLAIIGTLASTKDRGKFFGILSGSTSLGNAIGSFSGGLIAQYISIQMGLIIAAIMAAIGAIFSLVFLRNTDKEIDTHFTMRSVWSELKKKLIPTSVQGSYVKKTKLHVLFGVTFIRYVSFWGIWTLFAVFLSTILGASDFWVGFLIGINFIWIAIFSGPVGKLCDKIGRKPMILMGLAGTAMVEIFYALSPHYLWILPVQILLAYSYSSLENGSNSYVTDVSPEAQRAEAMGLLTTCVFGGGALGGFLGGMIAQYVGMPTMFLLMSCLPILGFIIIFIKLKETLI